MMDMADSIPDLKYEGWNDRAGAEERPSQPEMLTGWHPGSQKSASDQRNVPIDLISSQY
jgi:hypothetical protein